MAVLSAALAPLARPEEQAEPEVEIETPYRLVPGGKDTLWVLATPGTLYELDLRKDTTEVAFPGVHVFDILEGPDGGVLALTAGSPESTKLVLREKHRGGWRKVTRLRRGNTEALLGLAQGPEGLLVLTARRVYLRTGHGWQRTELSQPLDDLANGAYRSLATDSSGGLYVGVNEGEFGGGLFLVDVETGAVKKLESRETKDLCAGPLNSECNPVTGIIRDPFDPGCVLASIGILHMGMEEGRVLQVCGEQVKVALAHPAPIDDETAAGYRRRGVELPTEAIFGLAAGNHRYWAVTPHAVYAVTSDQPEHRYELPEARKTKSLFLATDTPGVVLVWTTLNWQFSVSGWTPLLAAIVR